MSQSVADPFPPQPVHTTEIGTAGSAIGAIVPGRTAAYVSSPITTGRRLTARDTAEARDEARRENLAHSREVVGRLRSVLEGVVIDPAAMEDQPGWTQCDYRTLWVRVIERYVCKAVFVDDWQYSKGCALEFLACVRLHIPTLTERLAPISPAEGQELIRSAATLMRSKGESAEFHDGVMRELDRVSTNP